jgi:hypothetical protein
MSREANLKAESAGESTQANQQCPTGQSHPLLQVNEKTTESSHLIIAVVVNNGKEEQNGRE